MYTITFDGLALHYYGQGAYGWGPTSYITGKPGILVEHVLRAEAEEWMRSRPVFCSGAVVSHSPRMGRSHMDDGGRGTRPASTSQQGAQR